jgi:PPOX class probable F420-dependent enzyme
MPSRRELIQMDDDEIQTFLDEERVLNVATIGPTGHPHVVAMWYALVHRELVFWTFGKSQKVANLRRDPKITGLVEAGDEYAELRGVEMTGTARLIEDPDEVLDIGLAVSRRYQGDVLQQGGEDAVNFIAQQARKRIGVAIVPERFVSWDHRKLDVAD